MKKLTLLFLVVSSFSSHAFVTLGNDNSCDYNTTQYTIQDLIDNDAASEIRVTNQIIFYENIDFNKPLVIKGGYQNCNDASADIVSNKKTVLDGGGSNSVIEISKFNSHINVGLYNLHVKNGMKSGSNSGGGFSIIDTNDVGIHVSIYSSLISNNTGGFGGGIYFNSDFGAVSLYQTTVLNNQATENGGGMSCYGGSLNVDDGSGVVLNDVYNLGLDYGNGGGIFAAGGCTVSVYSGTQGSLFEFKGVAGNSASNHGGGIYATSGSQVVLSSIAHDNVININDNVADSDANTLGSGGGIFLTGEDTSASFFGVLIKENFAKLGGGVAVVDGASVYIGKYMGTHCWSDANCNEFVDNKAAKNNGQGGAIYLNQGHAEISHGQFHKNRADIGVVVYADNGSTAKIRNSFVFNNGQNGTEDWSDIFALRFYDSALILNHMTLVDNLVSGASIRQNAGYYSFSNSIIWEPYAGLGADVTNIFGAEDCLLLHSDTGFDYLTNSQVANPYFVNSNVHDYRLSRISHAIDMCGNDANTLPVDFYGNGMWDDPNFINDQGIRDAGAHESYMGDVIFSSAF